MKIVQNNIQENEVWDHWKSVEKHPDNNFRSDIRDPLPADLEWCLVSIEEHDIENLHIISSGDWDDISDSTFLVSSVAANIDRDSKNTDTLRIQKDIHEKMDYLRKGNFLDQRLIAVSDDEKKLTTLIEGNRRAVVFLLTSMLVGSEVYIGMSCEIKKYPWAKNTYRF